ncbi:hypothetical protein GcM3_216044 [Golovinomyces cichoracearum]|uniref:Uncharacterized protein n=1 Tax=Golovinomyces cichoracearum TaxID=62708 RepID=A0A420H8J6_9PEZI|nr:hypothetical protein GcM3_216044 [Golovinomyces cichoracearum]
MTFHQPSLQYSRRQLNSGSEELYPQSPVSQQSQRQRQRKQPSDSQEWILFEPSSADTVESLQNTSSMRTLTVGFSQISDFESLETGAWSFNEDEEFDENHEEEEELDSLDSHLPEFRNEPYAHSNSGPGPCGTILPTHDGLGSFRLDSTKTDNEAQQNLYGFERFNPRQVKMRNESAKLDLLGLDAGQAQKAELLRRIELWRLEQSNLIHEVNRESSQKSPGVQNNKRNSEKDELDQETVASLSDLRTKNSQDENQSLFIKITRKIIQDLIGIDDDLLSILFGESLACDIEPSRTSDLQSTPNKEYGKISWELKILERIACELGTLASKISDHPSRFNSSLPFPDIPVVPDTEKSQTAIPNNVRFDSSVTSRPLNSQLKSTFRKRAQRNSDSFTSAASQSTDEREIKVRAGKSNRRELTREEWERDLDLKLVFRYICDRVTTKFNSSTSSASTNSSPKNHPMKSTKQRAAMSSMNSCSCAAVAGQCHHLISKRCTEKQKPCSSRTWRVSVPTETVPNDAKSPQAFGVTFSAPRNNQKNLGKNCRSSDRVKTIIRSGSSRNYWDWAESVGSGKTTLGAGPTGSWGEV